MLYSDHLIEFVDGTLEPALEDNLFSAMSSRNDLREELKQLIRLKDEIKLDTKAFTPPLSSTNKIFSGLGFATIPAATVLPIPVNASSSKILYNSKLIATGGIIGILISMAFYRMFLNPNESQNKITKNEINKPIENNKVNNNGNANINNIIQNSNFEPKEKVRIITKYIPVVVNRNVENTVKDTNTLVEKSEITSNSSNSEPKNEGNFNKIELIPNNFLYSENNMNMRGNGNYPSLTNRGIENIEINTLLSGNNNDKIFSIEVNSLQFWAVNELSNNLNKTNFQNTGITVLYNFNDNLFTGFSLRNENFYQSYLYTDNLGRLWRYEQQPNILNYSILAGYRFDEIINKLSPELRLNLGISNAGWTSRLYTGFEYKMYDDISMIIGAEYGSLFYYHNNSNYNSNKFGLNYGIKINY